MELNLKLPDFLTRRDDGEIVVTGTRVTLYLVDFYNRHYGNMESLAEHYPHIAVATLEAIVGFCEAHEHEIGKYRGEYKAALEQMRATLGQTIDLNELSRRKASRTSPAA